MDVDVGLLSSTSTSPPLLTAAIDVVVGAGGVITTPGASASPPRTRKVVGASDVDVFDVTAETPTRPNRAGDEKEDDITDDDSSRTAMQMRLVSGDFMVSGIDCDVEQGC